MRQSRLNMYRLSNKCCFNLNDLGTNKIVLCLFQLLLRPATSKKLQEFEAKHQRQQLNASSRQRATSDVTRVKTLSLKHCQHLNDRVVRYHENPTVAIKSLSAKVRSQKLKFKL